MIPIVVIVVLSCVGVEGMLISLNKDVTKSSEYGGSAGVGSGNGAYAVDGNKTRIADTCSCCALTDSSNPWYRLDLGKEFIISEFEILGRLQPGAGTHQHIGNVSITITDNTNEPVFFEQTPNEVIYEYNDTTTPPIQARFMYLQKHGIEGHFMLCELSVFGDCVDGEFGDDCNSRCHCKNTTVPCNKVIGTCPPGGCLKGYDGTSCDTVCPHNTHGEDCNSICGECAGSATCHHIDGTCNGCDPGYRTVYCNRPCEDGTFGKECTDVCGHCRDEPYCPVVDGICLYGCDPGYTGSTCKEECLDGQFGLQCTGRCYCKDSPCNKATGECQGDCSPGYKGSACDEPCDGGFYGHTCASVCGKCTGGLSCNYIDGICSGCKPGYLTEYCNETCAHGLYGQDCTETCGNCHSNGTCDIQDGTCVDGCDPGYTGTNCKQECSDGTFGFNCNMTCGMCYNNETCDRKSGVCPTGCDVGYKTENCDEVCDGGYFGQNCTQKCGECTGGETCNHITGYCTGCLPGYLKLACNLECNPGYFGQNCVMNCSGKCVNGSACNITNGECDMGCENGYKEPMCISYASMIPKEESRDTSSWLIPVIIAAIISSAVTTTIILIALFVLRRRNRALGNDEPVAESHSNYEDLDSSRDTTYYDSIVTDGRSTQVRLVGDTNNSTGRLEIFYSGEWYMMESNYLTEKTVQVVCRMLGYGNSGVAVELQTGYHAGIYGHRPGKIIIQNFGCTGGENDISECGNGNVFSSIYTNQYSSNYNPSAISCEGSKLRLVDGDTNTSGRVEIFIMGDWHTICDTGFNSIDARVICRMLGHEDTEIAIAFTSSTYGQGYGAPVLTNVNCQGDEKDVKLCGGNWASTCNHRNDAGVKCGGTAIRLANGPDPASGRVEIKHAGQWGTICGNGQFDHRDIMVLCGMLGYNNTNAFGFGTAFYGEGVGPIIASYPTCDGSEFDIAQCGITWDTHSINCAHSTDIGINCPGRTTIRLVGGNSDQSGRLEVFHNNHWGTVGSSGFDDHDLMVVCKMLGFEYTENSFYKTNGFYGDGIGEVVVKDLQCNGNENDIGQCRATWWPATKSQSHSYDVGVSCDGHISARLVGGHTNASGRVEVMHGGHYGTICDHGFTKRDLIVLCRMLGYNNIPSSASWHTGAYYGEGLGEIVMSDLNCNGIESSIGKCPGTWPADTYYCTHAQDVSLNCDGTSEALRLIGGPTNYSGRVEILHNGEWGRVCANEFDRADAVVLCRILGFNNPGTAIAYKGSKYGTGNGTSVITGLHCNGLEDTLEQCKASWNPASYDCYLDAGVNCCPACSSLQIIG